MKVTGPEAEQSGAKKNKVKVSTALYKRIIIGIWNSMVHGLIFGEIYT